MSNAKRQIHLNAFLMTIGHHEAAWRAPGSSLSAAWQLEHHYGLSRPLNRFSASNHAATRAG